VGRGHDVTFLERDVPWYAENRDLPEPPYGRTELYYDLDDLTSRFSETIASADLVIVGSYVPEGIEAGDWVLESARNLTAFYDIDTPVTLARLAGGDCEYLHSNQIPRYNLYLSFTGGPTLRVLEREWGSPEAHALYCSFDPALYFPERVPEKWLLGYLGTYGADRQPALERLLCAPAQRMPEEAFIVAGPLYPPEIEWPANVERRDHLAPGEHRSFYNAQRLALNVTRADMIRAGYSPRVRNTSDQRPLGRHRRILLPREGNSHCRYYRRRSAISGNGSVCFGHDWRCGACARQSLSYGSKSDS